MGNFKNLSSRDYFEICSKIERFEKEPLSITSYLVEFARERNLRYKVDKYGSVYIYKNTCSHKEPTALQTMITMPLSMNFSREIKRKPWIIKWRGNYISRNEFLGGESACGIALILELLDSDLLLNIEGVFTSKQTLEMISQNPESEEILLESKRVISLTGAKGDSIFLKSPFEKDVCVSFNIERIFLENKQTLKSFKLSLYEVYDDKFNKLNVMINLLKKIKDAEIVSFYLYNNARQGVCAECTFTTQVPLDELQNLIKYYNIQNKKVYRGFKLKCARQVNQTLVIQNGISFIEKIKGVTELKTNDNIKFTISSFNSLKDEAIFSLVSNDENSIDSEIENIKAYGENNNICISKVLSYPALIVKEDSKLKKQLVENYVGINKLEEKQFGFKLESSSLLNENKGLDMVCISPTIENQNTKNEKVSIASLINTSLWLRKFFENYK